MTRPRPSRAPSLSNLFGHSTPTPTSPTTSTSPKTNSAGLPLPSQRDHRNPTTGPKRSIKNLFLHHKKQQKQKNDSDLDFGCLGLRDDEEEQYLDEVDLLLEQDEDLHIIASARQKGKGSVVALPVMASVVGRQRSGSRNAVDVPSARLATYGRSHQFATPMLQSQQCTSTAMIKTNSEMTDESNLSTSSPSLTLSDASTYFSGPSSSRSSASFSSVSSVPSPKASNQSFIICDSSADNTPVTSTFSHEAHLSTTTTIPPAWHPDETAEEAAFRRAQEEKAAVEALEAYFAMQSAKKGENIVDQRRESSPTVGHSQQSSSASTVGPLLGQRRGSAPTLLRSKRSEGSLQTAARFRDSVAISRRPHFGRNRSNTTGVSCASVGNPSSPLPSVPPSPSMASFSDMERSPVSPSLPTTESVASSRRGSFAKPTYTYI